MDRPFSQTMGGRGLPAGTATPPPKHGQTQVQTYPRGSTCHILIGSPQISSPHSQPNTGGSFCSGIFTESPHGYPYQPS